MRLIVQNKCNKFYSLTTFYLVKGSFSWGEIIQIKEINEKAVGG